MRDSIYAKPLPLVSEFSFDEQVAQVFPDMIQRSVPGYGQIIAMLRVFAAHYAQAQTQCYDLGCSLGAATLSMRPHLPLDMQMFAVDCSESMVLRCRQHVAQAGDGVPVDVLCADITDVAIDNASIVVLNFTLQFVDRVQRFALLKRIYQGLCPGGILILSEKIQFENSEQQQRFDHWHSLFKQANGYSELEISQKRTALEQVMHLDTLASHKQRLADAGFLHIDLWFQHLNFISILACK